MSSDQWEQGREYVEKLRLEGLVKVDMRSGEVYIKPPHEEEEE